MIPGFMEHALNTLDTYSRDEGIPINFEMDCFRIFAKWAGILYFDVNL